jgi:hypothetical protein
VPPFALSRAATSCQRGLIVRQKACFGEQFVNKFPLKCRGDVRWDHVGCFGCVNVVFESISFPLRKPLFLKKIISGCRFFRGLGA